MNKDKVMRLLCYHALVDCGVVGRGGGVSVRDREIQCDFTQWLARDETDRSSYPYPKSVRLCTARPAEVQWNLRLLNARMIFT